MKFLSATQRVSPNWMKFVRDFVCTAWQEGEAKGYVGDTRSRLSYFLPETLGKIKRSWRLF